MITRENCLEKLNEESRKIKDNTTSTTLMAAAWAVVFEWCYENGYRNNPNSSDSGIERIITFLEELKQEADATQQQNENQ